MRKMKSFIAMGILTLGVVLTTQTVSAKEMPDNPLSEEIAEILNTGTFRVRNQDLMARVLFTINEDQKVQILKVQTKYSHLRRFIVSSLRGKKVKLKNYNPDSQYVVNVRMTKE